MNIAVYTIALNEEQFVERWYESAKEADLLLIADTGSTDRTVEIAESLGIEVTHVRITPWRFDDARNAALSVIPTYIDMCISLDMDEELQPGWRQALEAVAPSTNRPRYKYTWSWNADGTPGLQYGGDKIHARAGYRWKHPVHEVLVSYGQQEVQEWIDLEIHHHPDSSKPRSQYMPLLAQSVKEDPHDDRNAFYYARELFFYQRLEEAAAEFKRYLALPTAVWNAERAAAYRYLAKCEPHLSLDHLLAASREAPEYREPWVELAQFFYNIADWDRCKVSALKALSIVDKPLTYLNEGFAWGYLPHDLAAISCYWLGDRSAALEHGKAALALAPEDERLLSNLDFYQEQRSK